MRRRIEAADKAPLSPRCQEGAGHAPKNVQDLLLKEASTGRDLRTAGRSGHGLRGGHRRDRSQGKDLDPGDGREPKAQRDVGTAETRSSGGGRGAHRESDGSLSQNVPEAAWQTCVGTDAERTSQATGPPEALPRAAEARWAPLRPRSLKTNSGRSRGTRWGCGHAAEPAPHQGTEDCVGGGSARPGCGGWWRTAEHRAQGGRCGVRSGANRGPAAGRLRGEVMLQALGAVPCWVWGAARGGGADIRVR